MSFLGDGHGGIEDVRWDPGGHVLYFLGAADRASRQVMEFSIDSGKLQQLTHHAQNIEWYSRRGRGVCFGDTAPSDPTAAPTYPMQRLLLAPGSMGEMRGGVITSDSRYFFAEQTTHCSYENGPERVVHLAFSGRVPQLSPDGRLGVGIEGDGQALLFGTEDGSSRQLPTGKGVEAASWSPDATRVALVGDDGQVAIYDVASREVTSWMIPDHEGAVPYSARWTSQQSVSIDYWVPPRVPKSFTLGSVEISDALSGLTAVPRALALTVEEDANRPPRLVAVAGSRRVSVLSPNEELLRHVWLAEQKPFHWREEGRLLTGGLYLPRDYRSGHPVPLVVQAYHYRPGEFLPDGENTTADAAQLLVSHGMAVVKYQIPMSGEEISDGSHEGPHSVARLEAVVGTLIDAGIADPDKLGITGFSRAGFLVFYDITHPGKRIKLAAAITADSFVGDFSTYLAWGAEHSLGNEPSYKTEGLFWTNKDAWLSFDPVFNIDRSNTPYLVTMNGFGRSGGMWGNLEGVQELQRIGAFMISQRPIDYLYFPQGTHNLQRPLERAAMLNAVVDWMAFWLQDKSPDDPERAARWSAMKTQWVKQKAWEAAGHPVGSTPGAPH